MAGVVSLNAGDRRLPLISLSASTGPMTSRAAGAAAPQVERHDSGRPIRESAAPRLERPAGGEATGARSGPSFAQVLAENASPLHISQHARQRLRSAGVGESELEVVGRAVDKVAAKGGRESLVLYGDAAYVVSVRNRTLITVVPAGRMREHVFTNIDSAVLVSREDPTQGGAVSGAVGTLVGSSVGSSASNAANRPIDISSGAGPSWEVAGERGFLP